MSLKRTPLFAAHQRLGARLIDFGGWEMPVQYSGIVDEHLCVRKAGGVFDISHMGEFGVSGPGAPAFLNQLLTNDAARLTVGLGQYTLMCNERGGTIDDLYLYRLAEDQHLMVVNASRIAADWAWIQTRHARLAEPRSVIIENRSESTAAVAVQGPNVAAVVGECFPGASTGGQPVASVTHLEKNQIGRFGFAGHEVWVARTGYSGEDGFELIAGNETIEPLWNALLANGHAACLQPCGLGARDTLRTEMGYPLHGHELSEEITPIEAGLGFFVATEKPAFTGREVLAAQKSGGAPRRSIAFLMIEKAPPPRPQYPVTLADDGGDPIGEVTSGTQSPSLNQGIGMALVRSGTVKAGDNVAIEIRGRRFPAAVVKKPIYRRTAS